MSTARDQLHGPTDWKNSAVVSDTRSDMAWRAQGTLVWATFSDLAGLKQFRYIEHITVSVTPHITVYNNGSRSTSFESNTLTKSSIVGGIANSSSTRTFANKKDITWTVDGATLTYPTKYVQYLGFSGAPAVTGDGDTCAETTDASAISLPESTDAASFIYALPANATALALPTPLLQYLGGLDDVMEQFDGSALAGCAPLNGMPTPAANESVPEPSLQGNGTAIALSEYTISSSGLSTRPVTLPSGYASASGGLSSHKSDVSSSSAMSSQGSYNSISVPKSPLVPSSSSAADGHASHTSQGSMSSARLSILPHPYLNTTFSRPSSSSASMSHSVHASTSASTPTDVTVSLSQSIDDSTSTTATITNPGGIFFPSEVPGGNDAGEQTTASESSAPSSTEKTDPPNITPGPPNPGTDDPEDDDNDDGFGSDASSSQEPPEPEQYTTTPVAASSPSSNDEGQNVHTTAFVIEPITGQALITYQSEPTKANDDGKAPVQTGGGGNGDSDVNDNVAQPTQDVSNLIDQIGLVSDGQQDDSGQSLDDNAAGYVNDDEASNEQPSIGQHNPGESSDSSDSQQDSSGSNDQNGSDSPQDSNDQQQSIDLGKLNSAINSAVNQEGAQATSPIVYDPQPVYNADNNIVTAQPDGNVIIGEQTVSPGQMITIGDGSSATVIALETNNGRNELIVGDNTIDASPGGQAVTAQSDGAVVFGGSTVQPGQSLTIGSGPSATVVALHTSDGSTNLIVDGNTAQVLPIGAATTPAPGTVTGISSMALITTNGQTVTAIQSGSSLILQDGSSTTTVAAGKAATLAGQTVLAVPSEDAVFVNGNITPMTAAEGVEGAAQAVVTANGHTVTALDAGNSVLLVEGSTTKMLQDGSDTVFQGQTISAQQGGMAVVVNGHTSSLTSAIALATGQAVVTADSQTFSVLDLPGYVVLRDGTSTMTIVDGATVTFDGQVITALPSDDAIVVDGKTMSMTEPVGVTAQAIITAGGRTFTAQDKDGYVVLEDGTSTLTVKDGMMATYQGQTIKALASGDAILVNGQTSSFSSAEASATSDEVGDFINKGLSGGAGSTSSQTVGAASEPTDAADSNSASLLASGWAGIMIAGLFGIVVAL